MRKFLLTLALLLLLLPAGARRLPRYPFVRVQQSSLQLPGGKSAGMDHFYRKLDTLLVAGVGDVRILQVGGSHVQAGILPDRLRRRFLSLRYGMDGGRGLVFPTCEGNWDQSTCVKPGDVPLGLSGMAATALDTSARALVDLLPRERRLLEQRYTFNRVDLLGDGTLEPLLIVGGRDTLRGVQGRGVCHFDLPYYTDWLQLRFRGKGSYTLRGLYLDKPGGGLSLIGTGVNGASTRSWVKCELWEEDLHRVMPDLVIFSIGVNDIQGADFDAGRFKSNYRELVRRVLRVNPRCAILFSGINDTYRRRQVNEHTAAVERVFVELAAEFDAVFWDWYEVMGGTGSIALWQQSGLAQGDKVHLTAEGYRLVGDLLFDAIMDAYYSR